MPSGPRMMRTGPLWMLLGIMAGCGMPAPDQGQGQALDQAPEPPRVVKFAGKAIPDPPEQQAAWAAPATKLPRFLVRATEFLFEQGMADPRGCEYRQVEVSLPRVQKSRGFVLPERADAPGRFVVAWDGQVYPAVSVGTPLDLDAEIRGLIPHVRQLREERQGNQSFGQVIWGFPGEPNDWRDNSGVNDGSPLKVCLLLRLGRADLAEALFAAGTTWTPTPGGRDLTDYRISYLTLAGNWLQAAYGRLLAAHIGGDDVVALDVARKLVRFRDLTVQRAEKMGFARPGASGRGQVGADPTFWFDDLRRLDDLLRDHERRAKLEPRSPVPERGGDPAARVAALVRDLDQIAARQMSVPGRACPEDSDRVADLVAEGDAAVGPLLDALATDERLTRSVSDGRGNAFDWYIHPVVEVEFAALTQILRTNEFARYDYRNWDTATPAARRELVGSIRQFWEQNRAISLLDRWYQTLRDDGAGAVRWLEATEGVVAPDDPARKPSVKPGTGPMQGERLRAGREPSVTALMIRRIGEIERGSAPEAGFDRTFSNACTLAIDLHRWDEPASLPLLRDLTRKCHARSDRLRGEPNPQNPVQFLAKTIANFTEFRFKLGDPAALDDYADWVRTVTPQMLEYCVLEALAPLIRHTDDPAVAAAARWLFNDPASPWVPIRPDPVGPSVLHFPNLFASRLVAVAGFREGVLAALGDKAPYGTVERADGQTITRYIADKAEIYGGEAATTDEVPGPGRHPFRLNDLIARKVSHLEGAPRIELSWTEARRDAAVTATVGYLKRYADRFTTAPRPGFPDLPDSPGHLAFPALDRPATPEDVAQGRALFTLAGEGGEVRRVPLPPGPLQANWTTLKDTPVDRTYYPGNVTKHEYDTDGLVWQVEEVRRGDRWERSYGYVGQHTIGRAPAAEIEFADQDFARWHFPGGLDARAAIVGPAPPEFDPGQPVVATFLIRNRLGVERPGPTDFLRPGPGGAPALRDGVGLELWRSKTPRQAWSGEEPVAPPERVALRPIAHFAPSGATRPLEPLAEFEAFRLNLGDLGDLQRPGSYRLRVVLGAGSGLGEGWSEVYFRVRGDEGH